MTPYLEEDEFDVNPEFTNSQVQLSDIPTLAILEYSPLEKNLMKADMIWTSLFFSIGLIVLLVLRFVFEVEWVINYGLYVAGGILAVLTISLILIKYEFQRKSYALREKDIVYNSGLFWQSSIVVPFNRVQHCEVSQGPIDRYLKLSELKIFTAGGSSSDLKIDGLLPETAARIKDFIVNKTGIDEEE